MSIDRKTLKQLWEGLHPATRERVKKAADWIVKAKLKGGKVVAVLGSGPNIHEGITTLAAELIHKGIIDGITTSSAVINHEMAGTLEKVKRVNGLKMGLNPATLPADGYFEAALLSKEQWKELEKEISLDRKFFERLHRADGSIIIKVAGNMAYPTGLRTERIARDILALSKRLGLPFEQTAGFGADRMTMLGAGCAKKVPVLVTIPQMIGGGEVGLAIGDSIPISRRCSLIAQLMAGADVIIESAVALTQEIHDGPFETYSGHGVWADWEGDWTYSLARKKIIRIDLDVNLEKAWQKERQSSQVSQAVHSGLPKTKLMGIPFRMEMSGFARIPGSLPVVGDVGEIWPLLASMAADQLGVKLDFISYKQSLSAGKKMREWIVKNITWLHRQQLFEKANKFKKSS